jgi:hypothetical protein
VGMVYLPNSTSSMAARTCREQVTEAAEARS